MRIVLQRVTSASVTSGGRVTGEIAAGLLLLVGIEAADTAADSEWLARKITRLRLFADATGQMNRSIVECGGGILLVSQFTLHASTQKGARPSFHSAARPEQARPLYENFITQLAAALGRPVSTGEFGAMMAVVERRLYVEVGAN